MKRLKVKDALRCALKHKLGKRMVLSNVYVAARKRMSEKKLEDEAKAEDAKADDKTSGKAEVAEALGSSAWQDIARHILFLCGRQRP